MKRTVSPTSLAVMILLLVPSSGLARSDHALLQQEPLTVGVLDLEPNNVDPGDARAITERLRFYLGQQPAFLVIERQRMSEIMEEVGFQFSGACDTDECVIQVGRILGARKMVAGSVSRVGTIYSLQVRIIDIETTRIEQQAMSDVTGIEEAFQTATREVSEQLARNVAGQGGVARGNPGNPMVITTAQVRIQSEPTGAEISIDGLIVGTTPRTLALEEGVHELSLTRDGYQGYSDSLNVLGGENQTISVPLDEIPSGTLEITTIPVTDVTISIDGEVRGTTPNTSTLRLYQGRHTVELKRDGYDTETRTVLITAGMTADLEVTLMRSGQAQLSLTGPWRGGVLSISGAEQTYALPADNLSLRPGTYTITAKARGYAVWKEVVTLEDGDNQTLPVLLQPKSRFGAGALSLLLPGMGQFYSRKPGMGVLMLLGSGALGYLTYSEASTYSTLRNEHADLQILYNTAETSQEVATYRQQLLAKADEVQASRKVFVRWASILGGLWVINVLDAYALMPRLPRVGAGIEPSLSIDSTGSRLSLSLRIAF
ncbi:PEGA domain-containing protein [Candidatus Zixiibacteriota bacterium]